MSVAGTPVIGFIGLGAMGMPLAGRLADGGADVVVFNRSPGPAAKLEGRARIAQSPAEVADLADHVLVCLTTPDSYEAVIWGEHGLVHGKRWQTYVHVGTNEVSTLTDIARRLAAHGITTIDAPVTGGVRAAYKGELTVIGAGPEEVWRKVEPFLLHYAAKLIYLGETVGAAQMMKLLNNMLSAANLALGAEVLVVGMKAGLDPATMLEVFNNGSGQNSATLVKIPNTILHRSFDQGAKLETLIKDLAAFSSEAEKLHAPIPLGTSVLNSFVRAATEDGATADLSKVILHMERAARLEVPKPA